MNEFFLSERLVNPLGWILIHSLWQLAILAFIAGIVLKLTQKFSSRVKYLFLLSMMFLMMISPMITWGFIPVDLQPENQVTTTQPDRSELSVIAPGSDQNRVTNQSHVSINPFPEESALEANAAVPSEKSLTEKFDYFSSLVSSSLKPWLPTIVLIWTIGLVLFSLRPFIGLYYVHRLRSTGTSPVSESINQMVIQAAQRLGISRTVQVFQSVLVQVPVTIGHFRPLILLPAGVVSGLPVSQIEAILAHELSHIHRYDYLINIYQTVMETVFFYHPALWWLSGRIRAERENCCDDLAVEILENRTDYCKALLAVADMHNTGTALAIGAGDGPLLRRIKRIATGGSTDGVTQGNSRPVASASVICLSFLALFFVISMGWNVGISDDQNRPDEKAVAEFGPESHGLQCRIVPVSHDSDDENPDLSKAVHQFKKAEDATFAVELKNVSDQAMILLGVRYGESYPRAKGKLNTKFLGPQFFEFDFIDENGNPVPRAERRFFERWHFLSGASTHDLQPGESLKVLLRPSEFLAPMRYELPAGSLKVKVQYAGLDEKSIQKIKKHWPDKPQTKAWKYNVTSNTAEFSVAEESRELKPLNLKWGPEKEGLQAGLEIRIPDDIQGSAMETPGVFLKTPLQSIYHVKNVSDKPITFVSETSRQDDTVNVTDEKGEKIDVRGVWYSGMPIDIRWNLKPGEIAKLYVLGPSLNSIDQPGEYSVSYTIRFNGRQSKDGEGNILFPLPGDYQSVLETGKTPLFLRKKPVQLSEQGEIHGRLFEDILTRKPIRGATLVCIPAGWNSGKLKKVETKTDSLGQFWLQPPAPGKYRIWLKKHPRNSRTVALKESLVEDIENQEIRVEKGKVTTCNLIEFDLKHLTGKVLDENGNPVEHIVVQYDSDILPPAGSPRKIRAKADGSFSLFVPPGVIRVHTADDERKKEKSGVIREANAEIFVTTEDEIKPLTLVLKNRDENAEESWLDKPEWGKPYKGFQAKLVPDRKYWPEGTPPVFEIKARSLTKQKIGIPRITLQMQVEVDGKIYQYGAIPMVAGGMMMSGSGNSKPFQLFQKLVLDDNWGREWKSKNEPPGTIQISTNHQIPHVMVKKAYETSNMDYYPAEPIPFTPGKHTVRVLINNKFISSPAEIVVVASPGPYR